MVFAFALVEEVMKPLALFSVAQRKPGWIKKTREGFFYGSISGLGFFIFESLFAALLFFSQFPGLIIKILSLRIGTTLLIHALSSGIVGIGISRLGRGEKGLFFFLLITAALIHGIYNLIVFWVVM
jgi:RsiW-degrading membrane proteinase PrsW (M82 family)